MLQSSRLSSRSVTFFPLRVITFVILVCAISAPGIAQLTNPPIVSKSFTPASIGEGDTSVLQITVTNNNGAVMTGVSFTDIYPPGVVNSATPNASINCDNLVSTVGITATPGDNQVTVTNQTISSTASANPTCILSVDVTAATAGTYDNDIPPGAVTSTNAGSNTNTANATLTVLQHPVVTKSFVPTGISPGGTSALTISITNPNAVDIIEFGLQDLLPADVFIQTPLNIVDNCGGLMQAFEGDVFVLYNAAVIAPGTCTMSVDVTSSVEGAHLNTITVNDVVSTNAGGITSPASATLFVLQPFQVTKSFSPTTIAAGANSTLTITLTNPNSGQALTNVNFTDNYPVGVTNAGAATNGCGGSVVTTSTSLQLVNGTVAANDSCTVSISVTSSVADNHTNTLAAGSVTTDQGNNESPASATLEVQAAPTIAKAFSPDTIISGNTTTLTITLSNSGQTDITSVSFTDNMPSDVDVAAAPTTSCGAGVASGTVGSSTISLANGTIPANSSCTVTLSVTSNVPGTHTNTIGAGAITSDGGTNAALATDDLTVTPALSVTKAFSVSPIGVNTTSHLTVTITNNSSSPAANVLMTDTYPAGLVNATPHGASTTCSGGTATATDGGNTLQLTGAATLAASASCSVEVDVTSATAGSYANTVDAGNVTSSVGPNSASNVATLVVLDRPTVTKSYAPSEIPPGAPSTLTITIFNPNSTPLTGVGFTDTFDANITATPFGPATVCGGTQTTTTSSVTLSGATIGANSQCVVTVVLTSNVFGSYTNTIAAGDVSSSDGSTNTAPASATLTVMMPPTLNSAFTPAQIPSGGTSTFSVTLSNPNALPITGAAFSNTFPVGVVVAGTPATSTTCGGTVTPAGDNLSFSFSGGTIPTAGCMVSINVTSSTPGIHTNTIAAGAVTTTNAGSNAAQSQAQLQVMAAPTVTKAFNPTTFTIGATTDLTITLSNGNAAAITGVAFTDVYPTGMTNSAAAPTTNTCGGTVTAAVGGNQLQLSGGTIPGAGSCSITIPVTSTATGTQTNTIAAGDVTSGNTPANTQPATANVTVVAPPTGTKSFNSPSILVNGTSTLTIAINNPNPTQMDNVAFTDTYPAGFVNAATPAATTSCGGVVVAAGGGNSLAFSGGTIAASGQCTITVTVTGTAVGNHVNTIPAGGITTTNFPASTAPVSGTLSVGVLDPPAVTKSFSPSTIQPAGTSTLTITLTNNEAETITGIAFTDNYPSGLTNATPTNALTNCAGGVVTAAAGGNSLALSGASIPANSQCTVTVSVTAAATGNYVNTIPSGGVTATNASPNTAPATATLSVGLLAAPGVTKAFNPAAIQPNGTSTLTVTFTNPNASAITGVAFTDNFPAGMNVAATPNTASTCGGTVTAVPNATSFSFNNGIIPANGTCQVSVSIVAIASGSLANVIPAGGVTSANAQPSAAAAAATLQTAGASAVPALSPLALIALAALIAGLAMLMMRR